MYLLIMDNIVSMNEFEVVQDKQELSQTEIPYSLL